MFYQATLPKFWFVSMSIACLQSEIDTKLAAIYTYEKAKFTSVCAATVPFDVECLYLYGAYKRDVVAVIKMGAYIHGAYFLWVPIIPILRTRAASLAVLFIRCNETVGSE